MKKTTKRIWSVLLAVLMLVTVFPAGVITITASGTDGDFSIDDTTYTIDGPLDWNIVAGLSAAGETFAGKTIQLAADIDGSLLPQGVTLQAPLFTNFAGTFTGLKNANGTTNADKYYTVKNVTVTGAADNTALIAGTYSGTAVIGNLNLDTVVMNAGAFGQVGLLAGAQASESSSISLTIANVSANNCTLNAKTNVGLMVGLAKNIGSLSISNVAIANASVTATNWASSFVVGSGCTVMTFTDITVHGTLSGNVRTGGVLGATTNKSTNSVTMKNVDVLQGTKVTSSSYEAALYVGEMYSGKLLSFENCDANGEVKGTKKVAVFLGNMGEKASTCTDVKFTNCTATGKVTGTDREVGGVVGGVNGNGTFTMKNIDLVGLTVEGSFATAGVLGSVRNFDSDTKVKNITISMDDVDLTGVTVKGTKGATYGVGGMLGAWHNIDSTGNGLIITVKNTDLNTVSVTAPSGNIGGVIGRVTLATQVTIEDITLSGTNTITSTYTDEANVEKNGKITDDVGSGGLIGFSGGSKAVTIDGVTVTGTLNVDSCLREGVLIGNQKSAEKLTIKDVKIDAPITLDAPFAGGLVGRKSGAGAVEISGVAVNGNMTLTAEHYSHTYTPTGTETSKTVNQDSYAGTLIGFVDGGSVTVNDIAVAGDVTMTSSDCAGGMIGLITNTGTHVINDVAMTGEVVMKATTMDSWMGIGGVVGAYRAGSADSSLTVTNVELSSVSMAGNNGKASAGDKGSTMHRESIGAAGVVGNYRAFTDSDLTIKNVSVAGDISMSGVGTYKAQYHKSGSVGGLIGYISEYAGGTTVDHDGNGDTAKQYVYDRYTGTITIENCETELDLHSAITYTNQGIGGLIGSYGQRGGNSANIPDAHATSVLNISDCVVGGTIKGSNNSTGGVIGWIGFNGATLNIDRVAVALSSLTSQSTAYTYEIDETDSKVKDEEGNYIIASTETTDNETGLILGRALRSGITMNLTNCYTTMKQGWNMISDLGGEAGWLRIESQEDETQPTTVSYKLIGATIILNGQEYIPGKNGWEGNAFAVQNDVISCLKEEQLATVVGHDEESGAVFVKAHLQGGFVQQSQIYTVTEGNASASYYTLRFITLVNNKNAENYRINVKATTESGDVYLFGNLSCKMYDYLLAYNVGNNGELTEYSYEAIEMGGLKFLAVVITGIPTGQALSFDVTASYQTTSGVTVTDQTRTASFAADGTLQNATPVVPTV
ncbi:MAG: hypothetical protein E7668_02270 [Ruminococcaceae bacterium]|nr:hypothetical protein [Oscillospiraceae bacterium]